APRMAREYALVLGVAAAGALLVLLSAHQGWARVVTAAPAPIPRSTVTVSGQALVPLAGGVGPGSPAGAGGGRGPPWAAPPGGGGVSGGVRCADRPAGGHPRERRRRARRGARGGRLPGRRGDRGGRRGRAGPTGRRLPRRRHRGERGRPRGDGELPLAPA